MNTTYQIKEVQDVRLVAANIPSLLWSILSKTLEPYIGEPLGTPPPNDEMIGLCQNLESDLIHCFGDSMPENEKNKILQISKEILAFLTHKI